MVHVMQHNLFIAKITGASTPRRSLGHHTAAARPDITAQTTTQRVGPCASFKVIVGTWVRQGIIVKSSEFGGKSQSRATKAANNSGPQLPKGRGPCRKSQRLNTQFGIQSEFAANHVISQEDKITCPNQQMVKVQQCNRHIGKTDHRICTGIQHSDLRE